MPQKQLQVMGPDRFIDQPGEPGEGKEQKIDIAVFESHILNL
jgi:hypothetical protein